MNVTFLGHAGMYIETKQGSILCDPFFNPAYFGSWFPYPANDQLDVTPYVNPDYLFLSHTHLDHFDEAFLRDGTIDVRRNRPQRERQPRIDMLKRGREIR